MMGIISRALIVMQSGQYHTLRLLPDHSAVVQGSEFFGRVISREEDYAKAILQLPCRKRSLE